MKVNTIIPSSFSSGRHKCLFCVIQTGRISAFSHNFKVMGVFLKKILGDTKNVFCKLGKSEKVVKKQQN